MNQAMPGLYRAAGVSVLEISCSLEGYCRLVALAATAHPHECCGLLLGRGHRIVEVRPAANVHADPARHFEIDSAALIAAHRAARAGGLEVLGYYHSHPFGAAAPSATDRALASGDNRVWAIVAGDAIGWWRDTPDCFEPLSLRLTRG